MSYRDVYTYIDYPYMSKSRYKLAKQCRYKFKRKVIDGVEVAPNRKMKLGTALHLLYYQFFDNIDWDTLVSLDWHQNIGTVDSPVFKYFVSVCINITEGNIRNNDHLIHAIENFCMFEENHFTDIMSNETDMRKAKRLFTPSVSEREFFLRNDEWKLYGTIDRKFEEDGRIIIADYKTGRVPKAVITDDSNTIYTSNTIGHYGPEGNFYVMLYLLHKGYRFERIQRKNGRIFWELVDKNGNECSNLLHEKYDYAFIFTGWHGDEPRYFVARKHSSIRSIRSILDNLEEIRQWNHYYREPNMMRCQYCDIFADECESEVPFEIYRDLCEG